MNVDYSSQTLTLFEGLLAQKGRLFNALFFEPQGPENHTLFSGRYLLIENKGVPPSPHPQDVTLVWVWVLSVVVTIDH